MSREVCPDCEGERYIEFIDVKFRNGKVERKMCKIKCPSCQGTGYAPEDDHKAATSPKKEETLW